MRLLRLDTDVMGKRVVTHIRVRVAYWKSVHDRNGGRLQGYEPQAVSLGQPFSEKMFELKWIIIQWRCKMEETLPTYTINVTENFPHRGQRNLPSFAKTFGFQHAQDYDEHG